MCLLNDNVLITCALLWYYIICTGECKAQVQFLSGSPIMENDDNFHCVVENIKRFGKPAPYASISGVDRRGVALFLVGSMDTMWIFNLPMAHVYF